MKAFPSCLLAYCCFFIHLSVKSVLCWLAVLVNKAQGQSTACCHCPKKAAAVNSPGNQKTQDALWMLAAVTQTGPFNTFTSEAVTHTLPLGLPPQPLAYKRRWKADANYSPAEESSRLPEDRWSRRNVDLVSQTLGGLGEWHGLKKKNSRLKA